MTQYPNPYQPPPGAPGLQYYPPGPPRDPLAPARRASVMLFILGGLGLACGLCIGIAAWMVPAEALVEQLRSGPTANQLNQLPPGWTAEGLARAAYTVAAVLILVSGMTFAILGLLVRRGGRGASITGIVLCTLMMLWILLNLLLGLTQIGRAPAVQIVVMLVFGGSLVAAAGFTIAWLAQAARAAPLMAWYRQQMQAQYWHYQQQQPAYSQRGAPPPGYGYGYGQAPPSASQQAPAPPSSDGAPPPPPPPAAGSDEEQGG